MAGLTEDKKDCIIRLEGVCAGYEGDTVLEDINLRVNARDYIALIGPNGGGKTTIMRVILGLLQPFNGLVEVMGLPPKEGRAFIGYVPQSQLNDQQFPINVWDVVGMGRLRGGWWNQGYSEADKLAISDSLRKTGVYELKNKAVADLSGGQRQRVYISRALATDPKILLLDEPTANIDTEASKQLYELLDVLNAEGATILMVSHDLHTLERHAKSIGYVNRCLEYEGPKDVKLTDFELEPFNESTKEHQHD
ncbi:MAG TPA: ABC transporter ATP-binding protein [Anaerolineaceae bacterium]|nr:ABC transporter ATP-binding protein [Anaerolineaceae bacterium]